MVGGHTRFAVLPVARAERGRDVRHPERLHRGAIDGGIHAHRRPTQRACAAAGCLGREGARQAFGAEDVPTRCLARGGVGVEADGALGVRRGGGVGVVGDVHGRGGEENEQGKIRRKEGRSVHSRTKQHKAATTLPLLCACKKQRFLSVTLLTESSLDDFWVPRYRCAADKKTETRRNFRRLCAVRCASEHTAWSAGFDAHRRRR